MYMLVNVFRQLIILVCMFDAISSFILAKVFVTLIKINKKTTQYRHALTIF